MVISASDPIEVNGSTIFALPEVLIKLKLKFDAIDHHHPSQKLSPFHSSYYFFPNSSFQPRLWIHTIPGRG